MSDHVTVINVTRKRGDTFPLKYLLKDAAGAAIDITGFSFLLTVDPSPDPSDALANLFQLSGNITDGPGGAVQFEPTAGNMDQSPNTYFYDIQQTDAGSFVRTIVTGEFVIEQDITK